MKITYDKRLILERELRKGTKLVSIARMLGVDRNTIYEEFKRSGMNKTNYDARKAQLERGMK